MLGQRELRLRRALAGHERALGQAMELSMRMPILPCLLEVERQQACIDRASVELSQTTWRADVLLTRIEMRWERMWAIKSALPPLPRPPSPTQRMAPRLGDI